MGVRRNDYVDPIRAPFGAPTTRYPTPNIADRTVVEEVPIEPAKYAPLPYRSPHPDYDNNGLILVWQGPIKASPNQIKVVRVYSNNAANDDWYNFSLKFSGDDAVTPIYLRQYIELREDFVAATRGTPLKTVMRLRVTAPGTYTGTAPTATLSGGGGSGATVRVIMNPAKTKVIGLELLAAGTNYTSNPTVAFSSGAAAATAEIQPVGAVLVKEETAKLDAEDQQLASLFWKVSRIYETLPGPPIPFTRYDDDLGPIQGQRRAVRNTGQAAVLALGSKTTYEGREGSSIVSMEIVESWDHTQFPQTVDDFFDDERGSVQSVSQLVERTGLEVGTFIVSGGIATKSTYKAYNKFLLRQTIETFDVPGPAIETTAVSDGGEKITTTRTLVDPATITTGNVISGGTWTRTFKEKYLGNKLAWKVVVVTSDVFDKLYFSKSRPDTIPERFKAGTPATTTKNTLKGVATVPTLATGDLSRTERQIDAFTFEREIVNRDISSLPTLDGQKYDEELNIFIPYTEQVVSAGSALGDPGTEVTPLGGGLDLMTVYDLSAIASAFAAFQLVFPGKANLDLPDVLEDLELINEIHSGEGESSTPTFSGYWDGAGSWVLNPAGTAQGSQTVMPELIPTIVPTYGNRKDTTRLVFLLPMPVTNADVLAKVAAILGSSVADWPDFNPQPIHAVLTGRQVSLQVHASYHVHDGGSGASNDEHSESFVRGFSTEVGMVVKTKEIGPTIHGALGPFNTYTIGSFVLTADAYYDSESQDTPELSTSVEVRGAGPTEGQTTIPATGKHLLDGRGTPYRYNHAMFHVEIFDFANL